MKSTISIGVAIVFIGAVFAGFYFYNNSASEPEGDIIMTEEENTTQNNELKIEDIQEGTGAEAQVENTISVHYTGTFEDGTKFDSSLDRGTPFQFVLGAGQVIQGWDQGIPGMKVGGKRRLTIPPNLGYGEGGYGGIPPNSTLIFEVELLEVR